MWGILAIGLAACSFTPGTATAVPDGAATAPVDAPTFSACTVAPTNPATPTGILGGMSGSAQPDLGCAAGELPIGMGFDFSTFPVAGGQPAVIAVHVRCGRIQRDTTGAMRTTPAEVRDAPGYMGICIGWSATAVAEEFCPSGQVVVAMTANEPDTSMYNSIAIRCAPLTADMHVTGVATTLAFPTTGSFANHTQSASCGTDAAIVGFEVRTGCGQDELVPRCAAVRCN